MRNINFIKLFIKENDYCHEVALNLKNELIKNNFQIVENNYDLAIAIGGDGTFLKMVHETEFNENIYYVGINAGTVGFLSEIEVNDIVNFVQKLNNNEYSFHELSYNTTNIWLSSEERKYNSLNEIVVRKQQLDVLKAQVIVDNNYLETFVGDGLVFSTSTGSTAYNVSLGGAIIDERLKTISLIPIAPISNKAFKSICNPLVLDGNAKITLTFLHSENISIVCDGKKIDINDVLKMESAINKSIKQLRINNQYFIQSINKKILN